MRLAFALVFTGLLGCATTTSGTANAQDPPGNGEATPMKPRNKTPAPPIDFAPGPELTPTTSLVTWLDALEGQPRLKLPVVIRHGIGIESAHIGADAEKLPEDAIALDLDDTTMGIALSTHVRDACPDTSAPCVVWIVGYFGRALPLPPAFDAPDNDARAFTVRRFAGLVQDEDERRVFVESAPELE